MIKLTKLNNHPMLVNSDLIKSVENAPDTVLTLLSGEKIIVRETSDQVLELVIGFRRAILSGLSVESLAAFGGATFPAVPVSEDPGKAGING